MEQAIKSIKDDYFKIAAQINAPKELVHFYSEPQNYNCCYIKYENGTFSYITMNERGIEVDRRSTSDPDRILSWLILNLTFEMASNYELKHRDNSQDSRRVLFKRQLELLETINKGWMEEERVRLNKILLDHPFQDKKEPRLL